MTFEAARLADMRPIRWMGELAEKMAAVIGREQDAEMARLKGAASFGAAEYCPDDAIPKLAEMFRIPTFAGFTTDQLRALCSEAFLIWEEIGLPQAIERALGLLGNTEVEVINYSQWPSDDEWFSKFWVRIQGLFQPLLWGEFAWGEGSWGSTATPAQLKAIGRLIVFCKSPQSLPVSVIVDFGTGLIWGVHNWGDTAWGGSAIQLPLSNLWGADWVRWGAFRWGNGRWITGEL